MVGGEGERAVEQLVGPLAFSLADGPQGVVAGAKMSALFKQKDETC